jgi:hypothetical protein
MFAVGLPGLALLLLRANMALVLYSDSGTAFSLISARWTAPVFVAVGISLLVGILTPLAGVLAAVLELACVLRMGYEGQAGILLPICVSLALAIVGPGGYSLDARLFGRRLIVRG